MNTKFDYTKLPAWSHKDEIQTAVRENQVVVIEGATGSGKTSLVPLFFKTDEFCEDAIVGVTEPRRIAAITAADFAAQISQSDLGEEVTYQVRFDSLSEGYEDLTFMTEGILIRQLQNDNTLNQYSLLIIDEAHERSINCDTLLGYLKRLLPNEPDLKVIIMSATIDTQMFSDFFDGAPIISIDGRTFPVEIHYHHTDYSPDPLVERRWGVTTVTPPRYVPATVERVRQICGDTDSGDILIFVPGYQEIEWIVKELDNYDIPDIEIFRLHGSIDMDEQRRALAPCEKRKVIIATNIAETSLTIDGVVYVIDSGFIKQSDIDTDRKISLLQIVPHSKAGCDQRAGRAGRTQAGHCYRLYTQRYFENRLAFTKPEIQRTMLDSVLLQLLSIGITDIRSFPFPEPPSLTAINEALAQLTHLGAIDASEKLTKTGREMSRLPIQPHIAAMIVAGKHFGAVREMLIISAFLSCRSIFINIKNMNPDERQRANTAQESVKDSRSDLMTYLKIYELLKAVDTEKISHGKWCFDHALNATVFREVRDTIGQLTRQLAENRYELSSSSDPDIIHKCALAGFSSNLCVAGYGRSFSTLQHHSVYMQPGSVLFFNRPQFAVAAELKETGKPDEIGRRKTFLFNAAPIKPEWLTELFPHLVKQTIDWESLEIHPDTGVTVPANTVFRNSIEFYSKLDLATAAAISKMSSNQVKTKLTDALGIYTGMKLSKATGREVWSLRDIAPHHLNMGLVLVQATFAVVSREIDLDFTDSATLTLILAAFFSALQQKVEVIGGDRLAAEQAARTATFEALRNRHATLVALVDKETRNICDQYAREGGWNESNQWNHIKEIISQDFDIMIGGYNPTRRLQTAELNVHGLIRRCRDRKRDAEAKAAREAAQAKADATHRKLLKQLIAEEYCLCPVCNEETDFDRMMDGEMTCDCGSEANQVKLVAKGLARTVPFFVVMHSSIGNIVVARMIAYQSKDEYVIALETPHNLNLTDTSEIETDYDWIDPTAAELEAVLTKRAAEAYREKKTEADAMVRSGAALRLTFRIGKGPKGVQQWQSNGGTNVYIIDRNATHRPSTSSRTWYCTKSAKLGRTQVGKKSKDIWAVKPFLRAN